MDSGKAGTSIRLSWREQKVVFTRRLASAHTGWPSGCSGSPPGLRLSGADLRSSENPFERHRLSRGASAPGHRPSFLQQCRHRPGSGTFQSSRPGFYSRPSGVPFLKQHRDGFLHDEHLFYERQNKKDPIHPAGRSLGNPGGDCGECGAGIVYTVTTSTFFPLKATPYLMIFFMPASRRGTL